MSRLNKDHVDKFYDYDLFIEGRVIYVGPCINNLSMNDVSADEISPFIAERFIKGLTLLETKPDQPVKIIINSEGGDLSQALAIYDAIMRSPCYIEILATGNCMSAATIILQAADKRIVSQNCILMVHDGQDQIMGSPEDVVNWAKFGKLLTNKMYKIYADSSDKSIKYWEKKCQRDYILTADEALKEGLADEII